MTRVAVVGAGIAGLTAAYRLRNHARVSLFEAATSCGGHAHTIDVELDGLVYGVDIAFSSIHEGSYGELLKLFDELGVELVPQQLTFSVQVLDLRLEWAGPDFDAVFAQRRNLLRPAHWRMLLGLLRFNRLARQYTPPTSTQRETLEGFLDRHRLNHHFREHCLLPMLSSLWGCTARQMLGYAIDDVILFGRRHGLFDAAGRAPWATVLGGSRAYVRRIVEVLQRQGHDVLTGSAVKAVRRLPGESSVELISHRGAERFDHVVLACHANQALRLLRDASPGERAVLGSIEFQKNRSVVHTDQSLMPRSPRAWAAWNYECTGNAAEAELGVCVHYWINRLQPTVLGTPLFASLNPRRAPRVELVIGEHEYEHPVIDLAASSACEALPSLQGKGGIWFCGAWTGNGFHEDGVRSATRVVRALTEQLAAGGTIRSAA